jgi:hypothetical protein
LEALKHNSTQIEPNVIKHKYNWPQTNTHCRAYYHTLPRTLPHTAAKIHTLPLALPHTAARTAAHCRTAEHCCTSAHFRTLPRALSHSATLPHTAARTATHCCSHCRTLCCTNRLCRAHCRRVPHYRKLPHCRTLPLAMPHTAAHTALCWRLILEALCIMFVVRVRHSSTHCVRHSSTVQFVTPEPIVSFVPVVRITLYCTWLLYWLFTACTYSLRYLRRTGVRWRTDCLPIVVLNTCGHKVLPVGLKDVYNYLVDRHKRAYYYWNN